MVRFDFLVDKDLKPWMVEANMSPNLFPKNKHDAAMKHTLMKSIMTLLGYNLQGSKRISCFVSTVLSEFPILI